MPRARSVVVVPLPPRTVAGLLRDRRMACAHPELRSGAPLCAGTMVHPGPGWSVEVAAADAGGALVRATGPLLTWTRAVRWAPADAGTAVHEEFSWRARFPAAPAAARLVRRERRGWARALAVQAAAAPGWPVVVAAALRREGRVLVAQRARPPALAGRWELPGGRVEAGETEAVALRRELAEELAVDVEVRARLGPDVVLALPGGPALLRVHHGALRGSAEPRALEHTAVRWVGAAELAGLDWVPADTAVLDDLADLLRR